MKLKRFIRKIKEIRKVIPKEEVELRNNLAGLIKESKHISKHEFEPELRLYKMLDYYLKDVKSKTLIDALTPILMKQLRELAQQKKY